MYYEYKEEGRRKKKERTWRGQDLVGNLECACMQGAVKEKVEVTFESKVCRRQEGQRGKSWSRAGGQGRRPLWKREVMIEREIEREGRGVVGDGWGRGGATHARGNVGRKPPCPWPCDDGEHRHL